MDGLVIWINALLHAGQQAAADAQQEAGGGQDRDRDHQRTPQLLQDAKDLAAKALVLARNSKE